MRFYKFFLLVFLSWTFSGIAQTREEKKKFRELFTQGNLLLLEQFYDTALSTFLQAHKISPANANVNYLIGFLYLKTSTQKKEAIPYLEGAVTNTTKRYKEDEPLERKAPLAALYYLGIAYHHDHQFNKAIETLERYKAGLNPKKKPKEIIETQRRIDESFNAIEFYKNPVPCEITNLGDSVNSIYPDYSPLISADESFLYFTSRRPGMGGLNNKTLEGGFFEDIWYCEKLPDGTWSSAKPMGPPINTMDHEATVGLSASGYVMFIYKDQQGDGNIFVSEQMENGWSAPERIESTNTIPTDINTKAWEPSACISPDGNTLYFVSDRKGGKGGRDIYRVKRLPNGNWSMAFNLGSKINTPYDEDAPFFFFFLKTLFFSSNVLNNMGGFDIFVSVRLDDSDTLWTEPQNLGYPVNTTDDDIYFVTSSDGKRGYLSSGREGTLGDKDIYRVNFDLAVVEPVVLLKGFISLNGRTDSIPGTITITPRDLETGEEYAAVRPNPYNGKYILILNPGNRARNYSITYEAEGFHPIVETVSVNPESSYMEIEKGIDLKQINFTTKAPGTFAIKGKVLNREGKPVQGGKIEVIDKKTGQVSQTLLASSLSGFFFVVLDNGPEYLVRFEAPGYQMLEIPFRVDKTQEYSELEKEIILERAE